MISQLIAEGAAASSSKGMLGGTGPADIQIGQAAPGAAMEDEASQGAVGRFHEASLPEVEPIFDHNPTWPTPPEPRKAGDGWSVVGGSRQKMGSLDTRALIVWGVPYDIPASAVQCVLGNAVEDCKWVGVGLHRHVRALYANSMIRDSELSRAQKGCKRFGWRAACSRPWQRRNEHRLRKEANVAVAESNPFQVLMVSEDEAQALAFLSREWPSGPRAQGAEASERQPREALAKGRLLGPPKPKSKAVRLSRQFIHHRIKVGSFNLNKGMRTKVGELEEFLAKRKFDVVGLQECGKKVEQVKGYKAFSNGGGDVAILVSLRLVAFTAEVKSPTAGQVWVRLSGSAGRRDVFVCSAHMPQESDKKEVREISFRSLQDDVVKHGKKGEVLVLADLNAKLGEPNPGVEAKVMGRFGEGGVRSGNGKLAVRLLCEAGLRNLGGQSPPPEGTTEVANYWYTRYDKKSRTPHAIDYILVSRGLWHDNNGYGVDYTDLGSDHHFLFATIECPRQPPRLKKASPKRCFRLEKFIQKSCREVDKEAARGERQAYEEALVKAFASYDPLAADATRGCECDGRCACGSVDDFIKRMETALEQSCGHKWIRRGFSRSWFDDEVKTLVSRRREAYKVFMKSPSHSGWKQYVSLRKSCSKMVHRKKKEAWDGFLGKFDEAYKGNHKMMWSLVKRLVPSANKVSLQPIKDSKGTLATSEEEISEAWAQHQAKLGTPTRHELQDDAFTSEVEKEVEELVSIAESQVGQALDAEFTIKEIEEATESLNYYKAGAADGTKNPCSNAAGTQ